MSATSGETLIVAFLSADQTVRAYELDLLGEIAHKQLGLHTVIAGANLAPELAARRNTTAINFHLPAEASDADMTILHVLVGQLIAFFRCLHENLKPDSPSADGVISRVVPPFRIY